MGVGCGEVAALVVSEVDVDTLEAMLDGETVLLGVELVPDMPPTDRSSIQLSSAKPQPQAKSVVMQSGSPPQSAPRSLLWRCKRLRDSSLNNWPPSGAREASNSINAVTVTNREKTVRRNARKLTRGVIFSCVSGSVYGARDRSQ